MKPADIGGLVDVGEPRVVARRAHASPSSSRRRPRRQPVPQPRLARPRPTGRRAPAVHGGRAPRRPPRWSPDGRRWPSCRTGTRAAASCTSCRSTAPARCAESDVVARGDRVARVVTRRHPAGVHRPRARRGALRQGQGQGPAAPAHQPALLPPRQRGWTIDRPSTSSWCRLTVGEAVGRHRPGPFEDSGLAGHRTGHRCVRVAVTTTGTSASSTTSSPCRSPTTGARPSPRS